MVAIRVLQLGAAAGPGPSPAPTQQAGAHDPRAQEEAMTAEARLWEDDPECAFICTHFDPAHGDRRMLVCNRRHADLLGMHKEELLARFARREMYVPFVPADWLANFVHDLDFGDEPRTYRFLRMVTWAGGTRRAVLVQNTKVKVFDSSGRVSRVAAPPAHIGSKPKPCTVLEILVRRCASRAAAPPPRAARLRPLCCNRCAHSLLDSEWRHAMADPARLGRSCTSAA